MDRLAACLGECDQGITERLLELQDFVTAGWGKPLCIAGPGPILRKVHESGLAGLRNLVRRLPANPLDAKRLGSFIDPGCSSLSLLELTPCLR